ncbi:NnrS family protein [Massilia sp. YIM B04103]|uniref:NnrS family protein n=1 Tax=Massilia sp. YIM B04103 TaxID=2963106 RepID=UPI002108EA8B
MPDFIPRPLQAHPLFLCGFRPFFLFTAGWGALAMAAWLAMLAGWLPMPDVAGGALQWHAHEMLYGFAMASVAGFLLTAVPEFTGAPGYGGGTLLELSLLWLGARLAFLLSPWLGVWPAAVLNAALPLWLLWLLAPPIWRDPGRRHLSFLYALAALAAANAGFFIALARGAAALPWLYAANGVLMVLIVVTVSRVSMRIVNSGVDGDDESGAAYLARPPRRNLATFAIALCTAAEFVLPGNAVAGWLALAASAAMLNLLNDWHVGLPLFRRWPLLLYAVYWLMALGYGAMGASLLGAPWPVSAGRHLLMAGAISLAILSVMCIAGRSHAGHWPERRAWVPLAAAAIVLAALLRYAAGLPQAGTLAASLLALSGLLWFAAFALYLRYFWPILAGARPDQAQGCAGPAEEA